jgi:hypothetical protein
MSISVGSSHSYGHLQRLLQPDSASSGDTSPTDALQSLFQAFKGGRSSDQLAGLGSDDGSGSTGNGAGNTSSGAPQFSAAAMSALLSAQVGQGNAVAADAKAEALIAKFDTDGDGKVSQSEFEEAIGSGADQSGVAALFDKLDGDDDGSVSQDELKTALQKVRGQRHPHRDNAGGVNGQQGGNPLQALLSGVSAAGATSQSSSNTDGSTSTTITYADGTKLELTTPAASSDSGSGTASGNPNAFNLGNFLKYMVSLQAKLAPPTADLSV